MRKSEMKSEKKKWLKEGLSRAAGVTLLEIMLVLAIAAMVIVMSVRYYQSASSSQQATASFSQVQAITAAANTLAQMSGDYSKGSIDTGVPSMIGTNGTLLTPWNTNVTVAAAGTNKFTVTMTAMPGSVCSIVKAELAADSTHYNVSTSCSSTPADFTYTYTR